MTTRSSPVELRLAGLHLLVLSSFAIAQPLFDLLGSNAEFFGARNSTGRDVVVFALLLVLVPPALLLAIEAATPRRARAAVHGLFVAGLVGLLVLQAIHELAAPGWLLAAIAGAVGALAALLYVRVAGARMVLTVLSPAPVLFLALFLFQSDASRLTFSGTPAAYAASAQLHAPVVFVVFDELPLNSLLDRHGRVDPVRFPHFAALERGSTWFANESAVAEGTVHAVPALLTGLYPRPGELPVYHDHPRNLFTLLGGNVRLHAFDRETHLCPARLCHGSGASFGHQLGSLYADTSVVYLHALLPDDLARGIPSVSDEWQDFWNETGGADPARISRKFLATIRPPAGPALWYLHVLLPHSPWRFLPSGQKYALRQAPGWNAAEVWADNQAAVDQYWQRHLLQLAYSDRLLGDILGRLRATGLYDRSLVVVTADHGVSFRAGQKRRPVSDANLQDIAYVPLFVKLPRQRRGRVVRTPTRAVDVLPTIAAALNVPIPWAIDGQNVLSPRRRERFVVVEKDHGRRFVVPTAELEAKRKTALRRQLRIFGSDQPLATLYAVGPYRSLLGRRLSTLRIRAGSGLKLDPVDLSSPLVQVSGRLPPSVRAVAVAARGKIVAVVPAGQGQFWALVPRSELRGATKVFAVDGPHEMRELGAPLPSSEQVGATALR